jgi:murein DD-endopeptidase MepM/ murein hydrolase activator NlpD
MTKKRFSLIIVPHCAKRFKTVTLSQRTLKVLIAVSVFCFLVLGVFIVDYLTMNVTRSKYKALLKESAEQGQLLADYENSVRKLRQTVKDYESYTKKLSVMAGLKSPEVMEGMGIGGGPTEGIENQAMPAAPPSAQGVTLQDAKELAQKAEDVGKNLDVLTSYFEMQAVKLAFTPTIWPTIGWVSSPFTYRLDPFTGQKTFHYGIDIATNFGNPVVATADGIVLSTGLDKMAGKNIVLSHGSGVTTHYLHLSKVLVRAGQKIKRGDIIGLVGKTGKALGPHLHYEVQVNNRPKNPYDYILEE